MFVLSSYPKADCVLHLWVRVELEEENQNPCKAEGMFVVDRWRWVYYLAPCHGPSVGKVTVACSILNLLQLCKLLLAVTNLCKEEWMREEACGIVYQQKPLDSPLRLLATFLMALILKFVPVVRLFSQILFSAPSAIHTLENGSHLCKSPLHLHLESLYPSPNTESMGNLYKWTAISSTFVSTSGISSILTFGFVGPCDRGAAMALVLASLACGHSKCLTMMHMAMRKAEPSLRKDPWTMLK